MGGIPSFHFSNDFSSHCCINHYRNGEYSYGNTSILFPENLTLLGRQTARIRKKFKHSWKLVSRMDAKA
jgi:hypothetical protein